MIHLQGVKTILSTAGRRKYTAQDRDEARNARLASVARCAELATLLETLDERVDNNWQQSYTDALEKVRPVIVRLNDVHGRLVEAADLVFAERMIPHDE